MAADHGLRPSVTLTDLYPNTDAAARIKPARGAVRDEARKTLVIANARSDAIARGLPADALAEIWERLVEASIAYELVEWDLVSAAAVPPSARAR